MNAEYFYFVFPFVVVWTPPYSNGVKRQPCYSLNEAERMVEWFRSINVKANIVRPIINELEWKDE